MSSMLPSEAANEVFPTVSIVESKKKKSKFDALLEERWQRAPLWYQLGDLPNKRLEGRYAFLVELNEKRAAQRRPPEDVQNLRQPFNAEKFNFNKVDDREVLFRDDDDNALIVNVSPLGWCHSLVVPTISKCLPQVLTADGLNLTIDLMFRSGSADLRGGFNSLGGFASVNHQHLHLYHVKHRLLLETMFVTSVGAKIFALREYPAKALLFSVSVNDRSSVELLLRVTDMLLDENLSYNVFLTRGSMPGVCYFCPPTSYEVVRIYLWARKPYLGIKCSKIFTVALSELAGHFPVNSQEAYDSISEEMIVERQKFFCDEPFEQMMDLLKRNKLLNS